MFRTPGSRQDGRLAEVMILVELVNNTRKCDSVKPENELNQEISSVDYCGGPTEGSVWDVVGDRSRCNRSRL